MALCQLWMLCSRFLAIDDSIPFYARFAMFAYTSLDKQRQLMLAPEENMTEKFTFQVSEIKFSKDGFVIVRTTKGESVAGKFAAREGVCYSAEGAWDKTSPKALMYGPTFKLESAVAVRMTSPAALGRFLTLQMRGKGVGETVISALVECCEDEKLDLEELLDKNEYDTLVEMVGKRNRSKIEKLLEVWPKIKPAADIMSPLLGYGLSEAMAESVVALYGNRAIQMVEDHPYELILRVSGVSFLTADRIAMKVGRIGRTDPLRLRAALSNGMQAATSNGDIGVRRKTLVDKTLPLVNEAVIENGRRKLAPGVPLVVSRELLDEVLDEMISGKYVDEDGMECGFSARLVQFADEKGELVVWYAPLVDAEQNIARRLSRFCAPARPDLVAVVDRFAAEAGMTLSAEQRAGVVMALTSPVSVITGGPGCGKSAMLKVLLAIFDHAKLQGNLAAPTGKAAKRITEATGKPAQTVHSLIGFAPGGKVSFDQANPLSAAFLVLDEWSMGDTELTSALLEAAHNRCRIILVGDVDQLPSVGPGQVLRDIIRANVIPVTRLTKGFRFSGGIAAAAREINAGKVPESTEDEQFIFVETETPAQALMDAVKDIRATGAVSDDDIQVLAPVHRGDAGCMALNQAMQALLNPEPRSGTAQRIRRDSGDIRVNDRVIQNKNDRELGLVNGDIGWVTAMSSDKGSIELTLPDKDLPVKMGSNQTNNLSLAYVITVHKSQGAEAPYILIALDRSASFMLRRSLVYTAVTRARNKVMVFSSRDTFSSAVRRGEPPEGSRRTSLVSKLQVFMPQLGSSAGSSKGGDPVASAMKMADVTADIEF